MEKDKKKWTMEEVIKEINQLAAIKKIRELTKHEKEYREQLKEFYIKNIKANVEQQLEKIHPKKIQDEIETQLQKIDLEKIKSEINNINIFKKSDKQTTDLNEDDEKELNEEIEKELENESK